MIAEYVREKMSKGPRYSVVPLSAKAAYGIICNLTNEYFKGPDTDKPWASNKFDDVCTRCASMNDEDPITLALEKERLEREKAERGKMTEREMKWAIEEWTRAEIKKPRSKKYYQYDDTHFDTINEKPVRTAVIEYLAWLLLGVGVEFVRLD